MLTSNGLRFLAVVSMCKINGFSMVSPLCIYHVSIKEITAE
jgi:hypothetical protein